MTEPKAMYQVLLANAQKNTWEFLTGLIAELKFYELLLVEDLNAFLENPPANCNPILIIVDGQAELGLASECTQVMKSTYSCPVMVLHGAENPIDFALFKKNGADRIVHFHFDREFISDLILELAPVDFGSDVPLAALNSIDLNEIHAEENINFDLFIHLPTNQKTIMIKKKGTPPGDLKKIKEAKQHVYFQKTEIKQFLEYSRTSLSNASNANKVSLTEKSIKAKRVIFEIMAEFFSDQANNFEIGKGILERCKKVLNEYNLLKPYSFEQAQDQMYKVSGQHRTFYNDAIYLSNFAALVGHMLGLSIPEIENLALACLLHNIGLSKVPEFVPGQKIESLSPAGLELYKKYPERSVYLVKSQRVPLNNTVTNVISQHRELPSGGGFPNGVGSDKFDPMTKVFHIALRLYELTAIIEDAPRFTFKAAVSEMQSEVASGKAQFDISLYSKIFKKLKSA